MVTRVNRSLRGAIYKAARPCVQGSSPLFEIGYRESAADPTRRTENGNLQTEEADLWDMVRLCDLSELNFDARGRCVLDLYATTGRSDKRELETNVTVWLALVDGNTRVLGAWEFDGAPDFNRAPDQIEEAWQNLINAISKATPDAV